MLIIFVSVSAVFACKIYFPLNDFLRYKKVMGHHLSMSFLLVFPVTILIFTGTYLLLSAIVGLVIFYFSDLSFADAISYIPSMKNYFLDFLDGIPTLITLPRLLVVVIIFLIWSFLLYAFHRLGHESRLWWLLSHRPHHVSTSLTTFTVFAADHDFVLGFVWKLLWITMPMLVAKLIYPEPIVLEFVVLLCFWGCFDALNHTSTYYESLMKKETVLLKTHRFFNTGPFHVLHHSSLLEHQKVNLCSHFFLWDRLFGTYCEPLKKIPPLGLTDQPLIHMTPFKLAFSGILQIMHELIHNKSFNTRMKIIFGHIDYVPPVSKSFLVKDSVSQGYEPHLVANQ
jgi:sterol desaturase/sphingolipid hydroxylase (fatty acid hydroxylase superfamily)